MREVLVGIAVIMGAAVLSSAVAAVAVLWQLRTYVLPHFQPPRPGEEDTSIPARQERMASDVAELRDETKALRVDLVDHMHEEDRLRADSQSRLDSSLRRLHDRIDLLPRRRRWQR